MSIKDKTTTPDVVRNWPYDFQTISTGGEHYDYLGAFASELRHIDVFIEELYEQRFIETATNRELEKLGAGFGATREAGEDDDAFRYRARLRKAIAASDGTPEDIEGILAIAFGDDALETIDISHSTGSPVLQIDIPQTEIDDIPLTRSEFESIFEKAFPAGHGISVTTSDTFVFGQSGSQGLGNGGLI